jgi:hypothetical protein
MHPKRAPANHTSLHAFHALIRTCALTMWLQQSQQTRSGARSRSRFVAGALIVLVVTSSTVVSSKSAGGADLRPTHPHTVVPRAAEGLQGGKDSHLKVRWVLSVCSPSVCHFELS